MVPDVQLVQAPPLHRSLLCHREALWFRFHVSHLMVQGSLTNKKKHVQSCTNIVSNSLQSYPNFGHIFHQATPVCKITICEHTSTVTVVQQFCTRTIFHVISGHVTLTWRASYSFRPSWTRRPCRPGPASWASRAILSHYPLT